MKRKNTYPNKGFALRYLLIAAYKRLIENSLRVNQMIKKKNPTVPTFVHGAAFGDKH